MKVPQGHMVASDCTNLKKHLCKSSAAGEYAYHLTKVCIAFHKVSVLLVSGLSDPWVWLGQHHKAPYRGTKIA